MNLPPPKELGKRAIAGALGSLRKGDGAGRAVILCYHSVHPNRGFASATPALFAAQLDWLQEHCRVVPLAEIRSTAAVPEDRPLAAITFDDGYEDNFTHAFPLLAERGLPAAFFVTAGLLERDEAVVARIAALRGCPQEEVAPMTWEQVREMRAAGAEVGSHTWSHPNLARLDSEARAVELQRSKAVIEERLDASVTSFAYPFGRPRRHVTQVVADGVAAAGYSLALSTATRAVRPSDSSFQLPRIIVHRDDPEALRRKVIGAWDFLGWWQERAPLWAVQMLRPGDAAY